MNYFKLLFFVFTALLVNVCCAQHQTKTLPQTVIFKIKEEFRTQCFSDKITNPDFSKMVSDIGAYKLVKVFPKKQKERIEGNVDLSLIYEMNYTKPFSVAEVIRGLEKLKITDYVEPYYLPELTYTPNDPSLSSQYYINLIQAENAWNINQGDTTIVIGITDTGWDPTHLDLLDNVKINYDDPINGLDDDNDGYLDNYLGWDLGMNDNDALWESTGHGVNVTGIAAAATDNAIGIVGVGFKTKFLPIKISDNVGLLTKAYQGVVYAADHGCFIINCSWGSYTASQFNQNVIDYATINKGCLVIAAVGNDNSTNVFYPAGYKGVLSVSATDQNDFKKNNSNYGYYVDVSAPGEAMWTTGPNGGYGINGGTSMAAPVVSGAAAILKAQFPAYTNEQIAALIQAMADDINPVNSGYIDQLGSGRLNLFNAVSVGSAQFMELTNNIVLDYNNGLFVYDDTLHIESFFKNYLDPISGITVTLSSTSSYVNIIDGLTALPALGTMATTSNNADKFKVEVLSGAPVNEVVTFKAVISNGIYTNNEYFTITLNPDYIDLAENLVATTITSNGKIGFNDPNNSIGLGFTYNGEQLLYESGLMIGDGNTRVADVVRGITGQDQDFGAQLNVQYNPPYKSSKDLYGITNDAPMITPMDISIEQFSYAYANSPDHKYVIVVYHIENTGLSSLNNLYAGIFADWDIIDYNLNKAGYDAGRKMGYAYSLNNDTIYAAIKLLSANTGLNYALDVDGSNGIDINGGGFSTAEKYSSLSTLKNTAGGVGGGDVAHVVATGSFNLNPGEHELIAFAIIAGDSLLDVQNSADAAQIRYDADALVVEDYAIADGVDLYPNPTSGLVYVESASPIQGVTIRNMLGEIMQETTLKTIDVSAYPDGIYLVEIRTKMLKIVKKIVVAK